MAEATETQGPPRQAKQQEPPPEGQVGPFKYRVTYKEKGTGRERSYSTMIVPDNGDPDAVWRLHLATKKILRGVAPSDVSVVRLGPLDEADLVRVRRAFGQHPVRQDPAPRSGLSGAAMESALRADSK